MSGLACAIRYIKAVRGRHLSWEENVEIRGGQGPIAQPDHVAGQCF